MDTDNNKSLKIAKSWAVFIFPLICISAGGVHYIKGLWSWDCSPSILCSALVLMGGFHFYSGNARSFDDIRSLTESENEGVQ